MTKHEILKSYFDIVFEDLNEWITEASGLLKKLKTVATVTHIAANKLRKINQSINSLKGTINVLFLAYKDMEDEYQLKPLSLEYWEEFGEKLSEIKDIIDKVKNIAYSYQETIEQSSIPLADLDKYINPNNQKSLDLLQTLDEDAFLKILERGFLVGI
jgi:ABC-type transporter Mla subunit MlaD